MDPGPLPAWRRRLSAAFPWLGATFLACVVLQVFLAGVGVFTTLGWAGHLTFIHFFEPIPLVMALCAGFGNRGRFAVWGSVGLLVLIQFQYVFLALRGPAPLAAALHPVNALAIFGLASALLARHPPWTRPAAAASA